jgi:cell division protein FtsZ
MEDQLRVTVVATGLGIANARREPKPKLIHSYMEGAGQRTGTDNLPLGTGMSSATTGTGVTSGNLDLEGMFTSNRGGRDSRAQAMSDTGMDKYDIPAFLRKQAD